MIRTSSALSFVFLFAVAVAHAQEDYNVNFSVTSGTGTEHVTGFIDLASGTMGQVNPSEVTAWSLSSVAGSPVTFSVGSAMGASPVCAVPSQCGLVATPSALTFSPPASMAVYGTFFEQNPIDVDLVGPFGGPTCNSCLVFFGVTSPQAFPLPSGTQIATRVPEVDPSSALSALTLLLGTVAILARRRPSARLSGRCYG